MGLSINGVTNWVGDRVDDVRNAGSAAVETVTDAADTVVDIAQDPVGSLTGFANDAGRFAVQNFNHVASIAQTGQEVGNFVLGTGMVATGFVGSLPVIGAPIQLASGVATGLATVANGDLNPQHIARNAINGPSTMFGTGLAIAGGGDIHYDQQNGIWYATDTAEWTHGRAGTTYGSMFVTHKPEQDINPELLHHESVHSDQWASFGGGIGFALAYGAEEARRTVAGEDPGGNRFEREAGLEDGGYR